MEEATGGDLLNVIRKQKRLSERQAGFWMRQLSDGVEYCHQRGVVHRDLKCENLLLDAKVDRSIGHRVSLIMHALC
jgi:serine kinase